jgi:hypothetical protein
VSRDVALYSPPPPTIAPPVGWRPAHLVPTAPPRTLPEQDHDAIDAAEHAARTFTVAVGAIAVVVLIVLFAVLCGQLIR